MLKYKMDIHSDVKWEEISLDTNDLKLCLILLIVLGCNARILPLACVSK